MGSTPLPGPSFSLLTPLSLRAFSPSPDTGTLFGPLTAADPDDPARLSRLIDGRERAEDLELCSLLLGAEAATLATSYRNRGRLAPYPVPMGSVKPSREETPWFLDFHDFHHGTDDGNRVMQLSFRSERPTRSVFMDFSDPRTSLYGFRLESEDADLSQTVSIDARDYRVGTEQYTFRIAARNFRNAIVMALQLSATLYFCGQYAPEDLGSLQFRPSPQSSWTSLRPIGPKRRQFSLPLALPDGGAAVSFAAQKPAATKVAGRELPLFNIDLTLREGRGWNVGLAMRRAPRGAPYLMPLHPRILRGVWEPAFARIFGLSPKRR